MRPRVTLTQRRHLPDLFAKPGGHVGRFGREHQHRASPGSQVLCGSIVARVQTRQYHEGRRLLSSARPRVNMPPSRTVLMKFLTFLLPAWLVRRRSEDAQGGVHRLIVAPTAKGSSAAGRLAVPPLSPERDDAPEQEVLVDGIALFVQAGESWVGPPHSRDGLDRLCPSLAVWITELQEEFSLRGPYLLSSNTPHDIAVVVAGSALHFQIFAVVPSADMPNGYLGLQYGDNEGSSDGADGDFSLPTWIDIRRNVREVLETFSRS